MSIPYTRVRIFRRAISIFLIMMIFIGQMPPARPVYAATAALSVTALAWNVIGLDSNNVNVGPNDFPVGARVCNTGNADATTVKAKFVWDTTDPYIYLRQGSLSTITMTSLAAGGCANAYFEVIVDRNSAAYNHKARYHIEVTSAEVTTPVSTPAPRELFVEHLVSQNRNSVQDIQWKLASQPTYTSVPIGGSMTLLIGNTYDIKLVASTATQGYNQLEDFITLSNTYFRVNSVSSTYSATTLYDNTASGTSYDKLYADSCGWDNNPLSPTYRSCIVSDNKSGGNITTNFNVTILSGGGTNLSLNSMVYDFSGSSYHYNSDYSTSARLVTVLTPLGISKAFSPATITPGASALLQITLSNYSASNATAVTFVDNLPLSSSGAQMTVDNTNQGITYSAGCLSGSALTVTTGPSGAAYSAVAFSGGVTAAAGSTPGTCTLSVNVKVPAAPTADTYLNTTGNVFINSVDTGVHASANLTVAATSSGTGGIACTTLPLVTWTFPTGFSTTTPSAPTNSVNASADIGAGLTPISSTDRLTTTGSQAWGSNGNFDSTNKTRTAPDLTLNDYFEFAIDTTGISSVALNFYTTRTNNGPTAWAIYYGLPTTDATTLTAGPKGTVTAGWASASTNLSSGSLTFNSNLNTSGKTVFRLYGYNANQSNTGADMYIDDVAFSGCSTAQPSITKTFSPNPVPVGGDSTLTFTLSNLNGTALTAAAFSDSLPAGLTISAAPVAGDNTCGGNLSAPQGGNTISLSGTTPGATIPANGSCTVKVKVKSDARGTYNNISGQLSTKELGTNTTPTGFATAALTVLAAPGFTKSFAPNPIYATQNSTLTFILSNPNDTDLTGATFTDPLPTGLVVAPSPAASTNCASASFTPASGATSITLSGGTIPANGTCFAKVDVTAAATGNYANPRTPYTLNITSVAGLNAAGPSDTLAVVAHHPGISILKHVSLSPDGPWSSRLNMAAGNTVYYRLEVENTGDVDLSGLAVTDPQVSLSTCKWPTTLPVGSATQDPTVTCIVGPVNTSIISGSFPNTATASGAYGGTTYTATSTATYAISDLLITKSASPASISAAGQVLDYTYNVANNSTTAVLAGPVVVTDNLAAVTCPPLTTVGNADANLDPGESITCTASYTVTAANMSAGSVTNSAYAVVDGVTSNVARKSVYVNKPDLTISKSDDSGGYGMKGAAFHWTLKVNNLGPSDATFQQGNIILSDPLPAGASYVLGNPSPSSQTGITGTISCAISSETLNCTAGGGPVTIGASTGSFVVILAVTPTAGGSLTNTAWVDPGNVITEANEGNDTSADTLSIDATVNSISLSKSANPTTYTASGASIVYTYVITNTGTSTLSGPFAVSDDKISSVTCDPVPGGGLLPSGTLTCFATYHILQADLDAGSLTNRATATVTISGNVFSSNQAAATITATLNPALTFTKIAVKQYTSPANVNDTIKYTLAAANTGNVTLNNVTIVDPMLGTLTCMINAVPVAQPATLAPGATLTCAATYALTQTDINASHVDNTATVTSQLPDHSTGPSDTKSLSTSIEQDAQIQVVKASATTEIRNAGQSVPYTFSVSNAGNISPLTGITLSDSKCDAAPSYASGDTNNDQMLQKGETWIYTCSHTVAQADIDADVVFTNTATAGSNESASASDSKSITVTQTPAISLTKTATPHLSSPTALGDTIDYLLATSNTGNVTLNNVTIADPLLGTLTCTINAAPVTQPVTLAPGASLQCTGTYAMLQADIDAGHVDNTATVTSQLPDHSTGPSDVKSLSNGLMINLDKVATPKFDITQPNHVGDTIDYALTATNTGGVDLHNVIIADSRLNTLTCAQPTTLAPGASLTCTGSYTLGQADLDVGKVENTATVTSDGPGNTKTIVTSLMQAPALTLSKTADAHYSTPDAKVGDAIDYTLTAENTGNVTLKAVAITDGKLPSLNCTQLAELAPGDSLICTSTYSLSQADIDAGKVNNSATATSNRPDGTAGPTSTDAVETTVPQDPKIAVAEQSTTTAVTAAGQSVPYTFTVTNPGNLTLTGISVDDPICDASPVYGSGDTNNDSKLQVTETWSYTCSHTVSQIEIDAGGQLSSPATADSMESAPAAVSLDIPITSGAVIQVAKSSVVTAITAAGQSVPYTFTVINGGSVTLTGITVGDPLCDTAPVYVSGDTNHDNKLQVTETWSYSCSHLVTQAEIDAAGPLSGQVTADSAESAPATASLDIPVTQDPKIAVAEQSTATAVTTAGQSVPYTFTVTNPGNLTLTGITVGDPVCDATPVYGSGDTNSDSKLQITETWLYSCSHTVTQTEIDAGGKLSSPVTADSTESAPATASLDVSITQDPKIAVAEQSTVTAINTAGQSVLYTFTVTNPGNLTLTGITVDDPICDATPVYNSGDTNTDSKLQVTETWLYSCSHTVTQAEIDAGTPISSPVSADSTESAPATASLDIPITQSSSVTLTKTAVAHFSLPIKVGDTIDYSLVATNSGNVTLSAVKIVDTMLSTLRCTPNTNPITLAPGEILTCAGTYTLTQADLDAGQVDNSATVTSKLPNGNTGPADTNAISTPVTPSPELTLTKLAAESTFHSVGDILNFTITATNTGNLTLYAVNISDSDLQGFNCPAQDLAPGASFDCTGAYTVQQADVDAKLHKNTAIATALLPDHLTGLTQTAEKTVVMATPDLTLNQTVSPTSFDKVGDILHFTLTAKNTGNVPLTSVSINSNPLDGWSCSPSQPTVLNPGEELVCTGTHTVTSADMLAGMYNNPGNATGTPPVGNPLTPEDPVNVDGSQQTYYTHLPIVFRAGESKAWSLSLGYEDLPLLSGMNDYDYNDWTVEVEGTITYAGEASGPIHEVDLAFIPRARGGDYNHRFGISIPANTFTSGGKAYIQIFDVKHTLISDTATTFTTNEAANFLIFEKTSDVFPGSQVNSREGISLKQPQRFAALKIVFDQPVTLAMNIKDPHASGLFFDPYIKVISTGEEVHKDDLRVLAVPSQSHWLWPEERVRIDQAYPNVVFTPGFPPTIQFPDRWWEKNNHCVYDGVACGTP